MEDELNLKMKITFFGKWKSTSISSKWIFRQMKDNFNCWENGTQPQDGLNIGSNKQVLMILGEGGGIPRICFLVESYFFVTVLTVGEKNGKNINKIEANLVVTDGPRTSLGPMFLHLTLKFNFII